MVRKEEVEIKLSKTGKIAPSYEYRIRHPCSFNRGKGFLVEIAVIGPAPRSPQSLNAMVLAALKAQEFRLVAEQSESPKVSLNNESGVET